MESKTIAPFFQMPQDNRLAQGYLYMGTFTKYKFRVFCLAAKEKSLKYPKVYAQYSLRRRKDYHPHSVSVKGSEIFNS